MNFDIPTILTLFILHNIVIGTLFAVSFRGRRTRATDLWIANMVVQSLGWLIFVTRGPDPGAVAIVLAGVLLCTAYSILLHAFCEFFEYPIKPHWLYLPVAITAVAFLVNLDSPANRNLASGLIFGAQFVTAAALFFLRRDRWRNLRYLIGACALAIAGLMFARAWIAYTAPETIPLFPHTSTLQTITLLVGDVARLTFSLGFLLLIEARRSDELNRLAALDSLTEAYNRRTFMELAERELARSRRTSQPLGLMILDLDHFKQVNDSRGHLAGDAVLRELKNIADTSLRQQDIFGRFGGEEFCVLAPNTDLEGTQALAERLRSNIEKHRFALPGGDHIDITASIGVSALPSGRNEVEIDNLIEFADLALYEAKRDGRNRVVVEGLNCASA